MGYITIRDIHRSSIGIVFMPTGIQFPHTRAQLALIARDHRFREMIIGESHGNGLFSGNESDIDEDEQTKVSSDLVRRVAALLDDEREEELKELLKKTFELDDESVSILYIDRDSLTSYICSLTRLFFLVRDSCA